MVFVVYNVVFVYMMLLDLDPRSEVDDITEGASEEVEPQKDKGLCSVMTPSASKLNTKSCAYESRFFIYQGSTF